MTELEQLQQTFTQYLRNPEVNKAPPDIESRRMQIYRELIFNNIAGFISNGFPVLKRLYTEGQWQRLVRSFIVSHQSHSPYFSDICAEFLQYLTDEHKVTEADPCFLCELAHYEWIELDLTLRPATKRYVWHSATQLPNQVCLNELCEVVAYPYEVHKISPDFLPDNPGEMTYLLVYRDSDYDIKFSQLNALTAHLLNSIKQAGLVNTQNLMNQLIADFPQISSEQMLSGCHDVLLTFLNQRVLATGYQSIESSY